MLTYIVCKQNHDVRLGRTSSVSREATAPQNSRSQEAQQRPFRHDHLLMLTQHCISTGAVRGLIRYLTAAGLCALTPLFVFVCLFVCLFVCFSNSIPSSDYGVLINNWHPCSGQSCMANCTDPTIYIWCTSGYSNSKHLSLTFRQLHV